VIEAFSVFFFCCSGTSTSLGRIRVDNGYSLVDFLWPDLSGSHSGVGDRHAAPTSRLFAVVRVGGRDCG